MAESQEPVRHVKLGTTSTSLINAQHAVAQAVQLARMMQHAQSVSLDISSKALNASPVSKKNHIATLALKTGLNV